MDTRFDCGSWCFTVLDHQKDVQPLMTSDFILILSEGSCRACFRTVAYISNCSLVCNYWKQTIWTEVQRSCLEINRWSIPISRWNEFKKYQQSKSPVNSADEPSDNTTAVNKISVDLCGCCNQPCDGAWCKRSSLTMWSVWVLVSCYVKIPFPPLKSLFQTSKSVKDSPVSLSCWCGD